MYKEAQVQAKDGHWYIMRIMPYRTHDNAIDGVVIKFYRNNDCEETGDFPAREKNLRRKRPVRSPRA